MLQRADNQQASYSAMILSLTKKSSSEDKCYREIWLLAYET